LTRHSDLTDLCATGARIFGNACAIKHQEKDLTYDELNMRRLAFAGYLARKGVAPGDRVLLAVENSLEYVIAYFGTLTAGATLVPVNPDTTGSLVRSLVADCQAQLVISRSQTLQRLGLEDMPTATVRLDASFANNSEEFFTQLDRSMSSPAVSPSSLAMILYTSGTTGQPKGIMLSHANLLANTESIVSYLEMSPEDSIVNVLPFSHSFGNSVLLTHLAVGGRVVIENRFMYPAKVVETLQAERPTGLSGVPSTFYILLNKTTFAHHDWSFLRYISQAGGGMRVETVQRLRSILPKAKIFIMYGQTEASARLSYLPPELLSQKIGSVGIAIPGVELRVVNEQDDEVTGDEIGEIVARGPNIMRGYLNQDSDQVLRGGWLHTGDMARRDQDGFIYVVARKSDFLKVGSYRISPGEIEEVIGELAGIEDVACVGTEDDLLGEAVVACVCCSPQFFDAGLIRSHCLRKLPSYKVPKYVIHEPDIPRTPSGKKKYGVLREKYRNLSHAAMDPERAPR
jgi:acyl-CoA synthetase (AMP-forming)/AMP-acid ligase II